MSRVREPALRAVGGRIVRQVRHDRLESSDDQLRELLDDVPIAALLIAADGRILYANPAVLDLLHTSADICTGRNLTDIWASRSSPGEVLDALTHGATLHLDDASLIAADGVVRAVTVDANATFVSGDFSHSKWFLRPRTLSPQDDGASDLPHAARGETLGASERRWRSLAEALPAMVAEATPQGKFFYFNSRLLEYTGLSQEELATDPASIAHPDDVERVAEFWRTALSSGESSQVEWRVRKWNGEYCWHIGSVSPIRGANGEIMSWVGALLDIDEVKRSEAALQVAMAELEEAHARLQATFAGSPNGLAIFDRDGRFVRVNQALAEMNGIPAEDHVGRTIEAILPGLWKDVEPTFRELLSGAAPYFQFELTAATPATQGEEHVWLETWFPITTRKGEITGVSAVVEDVTERRHAEQRLRESEQRFRELADAMPQIVWAARPDGEIDYYNRRWYEFLGTDGAEHPGYDWRAVLHPDDQRRCLDAWHASLETGEPYEIEYRFRDSRTGEYQWQLGRALPVRDSSGKIVRWYGTSTDIDDQKEAQRRLSVRERQQESIANLGLAAMSEMPVEELLKLAVQEVTAGLDVEYARVLELQPDGESMLLRAGAGWPPGVVGMAVYPIRDCIAGYALRTGQPAIMQDLRTETRFAPPPSLLDHGVVSGMTVIIRLRDGHYGTLGAHTTRRRAFTVDDLHFLQAMANLIANAIERERDEIALKETADRLRQAVSAKDEFLGLVSHELKTPITTIFGNAEVLQLRGEKLSQDVRESATEDIRNEAERLHRIVDNLLVLARMERGQRADAEPVLMRRLVQSIVNDHMRRFPHRTIRVQAEGPGQPIMGEPVYLEQIIRNLVSNAEKYSPREEPIDVRIIREGDELQVSVLDRGPGVADEEAERIFTPFYRSSETSAWAGGIGIGLAVCKRLVEAQDGRMWAHRRPDGGSDIGFALPVIAEDEDLV